MMTRTEALQRDKLEAAMKRLDKLRNADAKRKILVVEDNEVNRQMLVMLLENDFDVIQAENGLVGLELLEKHHKELSLVLLDVYMPECDGFEFLRRKSRDERYDTVPVIVATSSDLMEDEITCLQLGANDFIVKPYNHTVMVNRINNTIRLRESASLVNQLASDRITGLYSKEFFFQAAADALAAAPDTAFDMVCSDIENFKSLNDRYGEGNCDKMLRDLSERLVNTLPGYIVGGRVGGDAFAFLIEHQQPGWETVLYDSTEGIPFANLSVKYGIVENIDRSMPVSKIVNRGMAALATIRGLHGNAVARFDDELHQRLLMEQAIREGMEAALGELQFSVCYQPKYDVRTDSVGGAEALVRWYHPVIGSISPSLFIPVFERSGFITKLDLFVWEQACKEIKRCGELGLPVVPISVNASRIDFDMPDLPARIAFLADKYGIDHSLLHVELTETAYADSPDQVTETLCELKRLGFLVELDDFGAGFSSLVSLNMLPLDVMKLDMSMIQQATELDDFRIIESTIKLAQVLGLKTVVEGVETAEEARRVREIGCDLIQGYYYSKPLTQEDFEEYLRR